jgi:hypothetical protein
MNVVTLSDNEYENYYGYTRLSEKAYAHAMKYADLMKKYNYVHYGTTEDNMPVFKNEKYTVIINLQRIYVYDQDGKMVGSGAGRWTPIWAAKNTKHVSANIEEVDKMLGMLNS